jgi:protein-disulfide isomerase
MVKKTSKYKKQQQQQLLLIGGGVVVAILFFAAVYFLTQSGTETEVCNFEDEGCYGVYFNIESGRRDEDGTPFIGSSEAPIIIAEFSDFGCPHCMEFHPTLISLIEEYGHTNKAQFEYRPLTFVAGHNSEVAAEAAMCAAEQDAFWQFHDELFELQEAQSASAFTTGAMKDLANEMELDGDVLEDCMNSNRPSVPLRAAQSLQSQLQVGGTPSIAYSLDHGETWTLLEDRSSDNIRALIDDVNANVVTNSEDDVSDGDSVDDEITTDDTAITPEDEN